MGGDPDKHYVVTPQLPQTAAMWRLRRDLAYAELTGAGADLTVRVHVPSGHAHLLVPALAQVDHAVRAVTALMLREREREPDGSTEPRSLLGMPMLPPQLGGVEFVSFHKGGSWTVEGTLYDAARQEFRKAPVATLAAVVAVLGAGLTVAQSVAAEPDDTPAVIVLVASEQGTGAHGGYVLPAGIDLTFAITEQAGETTTKSVTVEYR